MQGGGGIKMIATINRVHLSIVIAIDKILAQIALILLLLRGSHPKKLFLTSSDRLILSYPFYLQTQYTTECNAACVSGVSYKNLVR